MENKNTNIIKGHHAESDNERKFVDGSVRSSVLLRSCAVGLGTYNPGWKWSSHAGPQTGKSSENHIGYILSGEMMIKDSDGIETKVGTSEAFEVGPGHDAWVVGNELYGAAVMTTISNRSESATAAIHDILNGFFMDLRHPVCIKRQILRSICLENFLNSTHDNTPCISLATLTGESV